MILSDEQILKDAGVDRLLQGGSLGKHLRDAIAKHLRDERLSSFNVTGCKKTSALAAKLEMKAGRIALSFSSVAAANAAAASAGVTSGTLAAHAAAATAGAPGGGVGTAGIAGALTSPVSIALFGIGIGFTIWGIISAHHAKQVAIERATVCAYVPAANDALDKVTSAVSAGNIPPNVAIDILSQLEDAFNRSMAQIQHASNRASHCNAACVWTWSLELIVKKLTNRYQEMIAQEKKPGAITQKTKTNLASSALFAGVGIFAGTKLIGLLA